MSVKENVDLYKNEKKLESSGLTEVKWSNKKNRKKSFLRGK